MTLSYTTPKRTREIIEVPFKLDGEEYVARKPKDSVLLYLGAASSDSASTADQMYAVMKFINGCLAPAGQQRIQHRLQDPSDDLEFTDLVPLMEDLAREFGADKVVAGEKKARKVPPGKAITPDGDEATLIAEASMNRAARRAQPKTKPAKTAAPAAPQKAVRKAAAKSAPAKARAGRALPR